MNTTETTKAERELAAQFERLLLSLKRQIEDDFRVSDDADDTRPGILVTFGATPDPDGGHYKWSYQTGDTQYAGGAYGYTTWGQARLHRRSNCRELAISAVAQIIDELAQDV